MSTPLLERKLPRRIAGLILGMMFACGTSFIVATALDIGIPRPYIFLTCLITLVVLSVCFYNKITALLTMIGVASFVAWFFILGDGLKWLTEGDGRLLLEKLLSLVQTGAGDWESRRLAARLIAYAACLVSFCTACRLAGGVTLGFGTLAITLSVWYTGTHEVFGCLALCAATTVAVSAAGFGRRRARIARSEDTGVASCGSPAGVALLIIPVALLLAMAGTMFRPLELAPAFRIRAVEQALDDVADMVATRYSGFTRRSTTFSLNAVGYGSAADLGGPVDPTTDLTLAVSSGDSAKITLLRGSVRAKYTGSGWMEGELSGSYRFTSSLWEEERADSFDLLRSVSLANSYYLAGFDRVSMRVAHYAHYTSMFTLDRPENVISRAQTPYFNLQGELFPKSALHEGDSYTITGWTFKGLTRHARTSLARLVEQAPKNEQSEFIDALYADYLPDGRVELDKFASQGTLTVHSTDLDYDTSYHVSVLPEDSTDGLTLDLPAQTEQIVSVSGFTFSIKQALPPTRYALFYGYTASQLAAYERYLSELAVYERRLLINPDSAGKPPVEPQPTAVWLSEARLASYGLPEDLYGIAVDGTGSRWNSDSREQLRSRYRMYYTSQAPQGYSALPSAGGSGGERWYVSSRINSDSYNGHSAAAGMANVAEANGFVRIEYAGSVNYYHGITDRTVAAIAGNYLGSLDGDKANLFDLAYSLADYLADFDYTLTPAPVPDGVDFVDWFLSTGEGYCTYYASAMAVMSRKLGIPSRYVEGYSLTDAERGDDGVVLLTGENAHAWAELFFDGVGFIPFDPISIERLENTPDIPDEPDEPAVVETPTPTPSEEPVELPEDEPNGGSQRSLWWLWLIGVVLLLALAMLGLALLYLKLRSLEHMRKKLGKVETARDLWREILKLLPYLDKAAERRPGETSLTYSHRIETLVIVPGAPFDGVAAAGMKSWYAQQMLTEDDLRMLDRCATELRRRGLLRLRVAPRLLRDRKADRPPMRE